MIDPEQIPGLQRVLMVIVATVVLSGCTLPFSKQPSAGLLVLTDDQLARVYVNNQLAGDTPVEQSKLQPGTHRVRLEPHDQHLQTHEVIVKLYPNTQSVINWQLGTTVDEHAGVVLELEPAQHVDTPHLIVQSNPDISIVQIDGKSAGLTPVIENGLADGEHELQVSAPGYLRTKHFVRLIRGYTLRATVTLPREASPIPSNPTTEQEAQGEGSASESISVSASPPATRAASRRDVVLQGETTSREELGVLVVRETPTGELRVRTAPNTTSQQIDVVQVGTRLSYVQEQPGWYEVEYAPQKYGWVSGEYVEIDETRE